MATWGYSISGNSFWLDYETMTYQWIDAFGVKHPLTINPDGSLVFHLSEKSALDKEIQDLNTMGYR